MSFIEGQIDEYIVASKWFLIPKATRCDILNKIENKDIYKNLIDNNDFTAHDFFETLRIHEHLTDEEDHETIGDYYALVDNLCSFANFQIFYDEMISYSIIKNILQENTKRDITIKNELVDKINKRKTKSLLNNIFCDDISFYIVSFL
jgi:hypothetical protein